MAETTATSVHGTSLAPESVNLTVPFTVGLFRAASKITR